MIWLRILISMFAYLGAIYYIMLLFQLFGKLKFTNRKMTFLRCVTPFYYWIVSQDESKKKN